MTSTTPQREPNLPLQAALLFIQFGYSVIPIRADGTKAPTVEWTPFKTRIPTEAEVRQMFREGQGIALVMGAVSGNAECCDLEGIFPWDQFKVLIEEQAPGLLTKLIIIETPRYGEHLLYRCPVIGPSTKLAMTEDGKDTLAEIRGEGSYIVTVTSPWQCSHKSVWSEKRVYKSRQGHIRHTPVITPEEREILHDCLRSFDQRIHHEEDRPIIHRPKPLNGKRPGDDYNARGDPLPVLIAHGWKVTSRHNGEARLRRPGKDFGISATFGHVAPNVMYCFSSNAAPFELNHAYDAFGIVTRLEYDGDTVRASKALREQGYGDPLPPRPPRIPPAKPNGHADTDETSITPAPTAKIPLSVMAQSMTLTQDNCARLFEEGFADQFRYCKAWGQWMEWCGYWRPELTDRPFDKVRLMLREANREHNKTIASAAFADGVERMARKSHIFATIPEQWDSNDWLLNNPEDTFDLSTGERRPHQREDFITKCTQITPEEGPHPVLDMFLRDITLNDEALIQYHQRSLGACLSGALQDNFLLFWYGTGQNGKNTLGELISWLLGGYSKVIPTETLMVDRHGTRHPTELANLRGIRLAISSEVEEGSYFNEQRIKALTGDAMLAGRFMHQNFFEFKRTHKHLIYGNHRPMLRVVDPALKARLHIVPFKAYFPPDARDATLPARLRAEAPQILDWLIQGHQQWREDGYLKKCSAVQAETDSYFESQSTNESWLAECCVQSEELRASAKELYTSFKAFKEQRGEGVISQTRWGEWMITHFTRRMIDGRVYYDGLQVKPTSVLDFER